VRACVRACLRACAGVCTSVHVCLCVSLTHLACASATGGDMVNRRTPIPKNSSAGSKVGRCLAEREERGGGALRAASHAVPWNPCSSACLSQPKTPNSKIETINPICTTNWPHLARSHRAPVATSAGSLGTRPRYTHTHTLTHTYASMSLCSKRKPKLLKCTQKKNCKTHVAYI